MKKKKRTMKKTAWKIAVRVMLLAILAAAALSPLHLGNGFLRSADFDTVKAGQTDNVWTIAARYTAREEDAKELAEAIIVVNGLPGDGAIRAGQNLRVPIRKDRLAKVAER